MLCNNIWTVQGEGLTEDSVLLTCYLLLHCEEATILLADPAVFSYGRQLDKLGRAIHAFIGQADLQMAN